MRTKMRSLVALALVAVASAATATLAQKGGAEKPAVFGDFVKLKGTYYRISRIDAVAVLEDGEVHLSFAGTNGHFFDAKECGELIRALGLPPIDVAKPGP